MAATRYTATEGSIRQAPVIAATRYTATEGSIRQAPSYSCYSLYCY